jgi:aminopeptidase S
VATSVLIRAGLAVAAVVLTAACTAGVPGSSPPAPTGLSGELSTSVSADAALTHLQALQRIADENGGTRAAGTPGYDASVDYVAGVLRGIGFTPSTPAYEVSGDEDEDVAPGTGRNVVAETGTGDPGRVVMIGAHLDSVPEGPGIVDDGSGVASLLEIAARLGAEPQVRNKVRFAFFGHEETGSQGAAGYLDGLSRAERATIELYVNVDMVASPNGGYFVQGGKGRDEETAGPPGSATVAQVLADQLTRTGVTPETIPFVGDDDAPFIAAGIPVGGLENGDAKKKSARQATASGGQAGAVYDRCYHQACDRVDGVNRDLLDHYLRALAGTVGHFATSPDPLR